MHRLHRTVRATRVMQRDSANSCLASAQLQKPYDASTHLDEVAQLLVAGISRLSARRASARRRDNSTGTVRRKRACVGPREPPVSDHVLTQNAALAKASLPDLKAQYRDLFGAEAPGINRACLERRIAYRLQELAYGGLSQATQARLEGLAQTADKGSSPRTRNAPSIAPRASQSGLALHKFMLGAPGVNGGPSTRRMTTRVVLCDLLHTGLRQYQTSGRCPRNQSHSYKQVPIVNRQKVAQATANST